MLILLSSSVPFESQLIELTADKNIPITFTGAGVTIFSKPDGTIPLMFGAPIYGVFENTLEGADIPITFTN